jgi:MFS family permease
MGPTGWVRGRTTPISVDTFCVYFVFLILLLRWCVGAAIGATASLLFLDEEIVPTNLGWRLPFGIGAVICLFIIITRLFLPESPRSEHCSAQLLTPSVAADRRVQFLTTQVADDS